MKAWAFEYLQVPLMPDHEVCLSAFSIPDSGNQKDFFFFVPESTEWSSWTECMLLNRWTEMSGSAQATLSNLNLTTARYLLGNCKTVVERWTSETLKTLVCDSVQRLCVVFLDTETSSSPFFFVYFENSCLGAKCLCEPLFFPQRSAFCQLCGDLGNAFHEGTGRSVQTYSSLHVPEAVLCGLDGLSRSQLFRLLRPLGPLSCLFPSWAPVPVLTISRPPSPPQPPSQKLTASVSVTHFAAFWFLTFCGEDEPKL